MLHLPRGRRPPGAFLGETQECPIRRLVGKFELLGLPLLARDDIKEARADRVIAQMAEHFPKLPDLIEHRQVLTPLDLERLLGLTGGHALHGDMAPDQLLFLRPVRGWADYRTPIRDLYLCGAGTHPGGGVTGANGRNAAREILRDARRARR